MINRKLYDFLCSGGGRFLFIREDTTKLIIPAVMLWGHACLATEKGSKMGSISKA